MPVGRGGADILENLITVCKDCHRGKGKSRARFGEEEMGNTLKYQAVRPLLTLPYNTEMKPVECKIASQEVSGRQKITFGDHKGTFIIGNQLLNIRTRSKLIYY